MSQVQPPRSRPSHYHPETIQILRIIIINGGAILTTALLIRAAILLAVPATTQRGLHLVTRTTHLLVWPLEKIPPLRHLIAGGLAVADVTTFFIIVVCWLVALGVVAGWEHEGQRLSTGVSDSSLRP